MEGGLVAIKQEAISKIDYFAEIQELTNLVKDDKKFGNEKAEELLDQVAAFNDDMKLMVLNSYQMSDLAGYLQKENDLIVEWMGQM